MLSWHNSLYCQVLENNEASSNHTGVRVSWSFEDTQSRECVFLLGKLGKKGCELKPWRLICCEFGIGERLCWGEGHPFSVQLWVIPKQAHMYLPSKSLLPKLKFQTDQDETIPFCQFVVFGWLIFLFAKLVNTVKVTADKRDSIKKNE